MAPRDHARIKGVNQPLARPIDISEYAIKHQISPLEVFGIVSQQDKEIICDVPDARAAYFSTKIFDMLHEEPNHHVFKPSKADGSPKYVDFVAKWMKEGGMDPKGEEVAPYPTENGVELKALRDVAMNLGVTALIKRIDADLLEIECMGKEKAEEKAKAPAVLPSYPKKHQEAEPQVFHCENCWSDRHNKPHCPLPPNRAPDGDWIYMPANKTTRNDQTEHNATNTSTIRNPYLNDVITVKEVSKHVHQTKRGDFIFKDNYGYEWNMPLRSMQIKFVGMVDGKARFEGVGAFEYSWVSKPKSNDKPQAEEHKV